MPIAPRLSTCLLGFAALVVGTATASGGTAPSYRLVAAAPGYPGTAAGAQPTMDRLAERIARGAGLAPGALTAEYVPAEADGVARIAEESTSLALVPLAFFLTYEERLGLTPIVQVIGLDGSATERWSLTAPAGRVAQPGDLSGWEIVGIPAYAERFVRGPLLGNWGLPRDARLVFSARVLGALRRIAAGERVAVLLDDTQVAALPSLPNPEAYEVVHTSPPRPYAYVAAVAGRLSEAEVQSLAAALIGMTGTDTDDDLLTTLRLRGFEAVDRVALEDARAAMAPSG